MKEENPWEAPKTDPREAEYRRILRKQYPVEESGKGMLGKEDLIAALESVFVGTPYPGFDRDADRVEHLVVAACKKNASTQDFRELAFRIAQMRVEEERASQLLRKDLPEDIRRLIDAFHFDYFDTKNHPDFLYLMMDHLRKMAQYLKGDKPLAALAEAQAADSIFQFQIKELEKQAKNKGSIIIE